MRDRLRIAIAGSVTIAVAAAAVLAACRSVERRAGVPVEHAAAAVLLSGPNRLVTVDLEEERVAADVRLRSLALDVAVDPSSGRAVTAQCGGIADQADDVAGVYDMREGGPVRYVRLPCPNPGVVAFVGGRAFIEHGVYGSDGLFLSVLDPVRLRVTRTGRLPDGPGAWLLPTRHGMGLLATSQVPSAELAGVPGGESGPPPEADGRLRYVCVHPSDLSTHAVGDAPAGTNSMGSDGEGSVALFGVADGKAWCAELPGGSGRVHPIRLRGVGSVGSGCLAGRHIVVAPLDESERPARTCDLTVAQRGSGRRVGTIRVEGSVCDLAPWGDLVLAVTRDPCRLLVVDPAGFRVRSSVELGQGRVLGADVEVLEARTGR